MKILKWMKRLRFFGILCIINVVLCFLIEPARSSSGTMWEEYYKEEELDTVFVGASFCAASFDPYIFNEELDIKSFNMGTPLQAMGQTVSALKTALEDHEIKSVVVGMGFFSLQESALERAELTFEKARAEQKGGLSGIWEGVKYIVSEEVRDTEKSINYLFPWIYNQEEISWDFFKENVSVKLHQFMNEGKEEETKKGYRCYIGPVDYETAWEVNSYTYYEQAFLQTEIQKFEELLKLCKEHDVDVMVVNTPHPTYDVISCYETYGNSEQILVDICKKYGIDYYNFSLVKPEVLELKDEYFYDFEHLNEAGAHAFDKALCEFMTGRANGENMTDCFYTVEEYFEMHSDLLEEWIREKNN